MGKCFITKSVLSLWIDNKWLIHALLLNTLVSRYYRYTGVVDTGSSYRLLNPALWCECVFVTIEIGSELVLVQFTYGIFCIAACSMSLEKATLASEKPNSGAPCSSLAFQSPELLFQSASVLFVGVQIQSPSCSASTVHWVWPCYIMTFSDLMGIFFFSWGFSKLAA